MPKTKINDNDLSQQEHEVSDKHKFKKQVLGKGLGALLPHIEFSDKGFKISKEEPEESGRGNFALIDVTRIVQNPYQPRREFEEQALDDLMKSIIDNGVIQPITVRRSINGYEIISGERRLRASMKAGIDKIPAYILEVKSDIDMLELALIENVQREDLNPIETANGYQRLIEECNLTQEQVASKIGKDRSTITNFLRLLKLPEKIQESLRKRQLSMGHARTLLGLSESRQMVLAWQEIKKKDLSVRATETLVKNVLSGKINLEEGLLAKKDFSSEKDGKSHVTSEIRLVLRDFEKKLMQSFATQVKISTKSPESGTIQFDFYSKDDFERLIELFNYIDSKMN